MGNGGAGTVYLVTDTDGTEFALKCLREATSVKRQRFRNELVFCQQDVQYLKKNMRAHVPKSDSAEFVKY